MSIEHLPCYLKLFVAMTDTAGRFSTALAAYSRAADLAPGIGECYRHNSWHAPPL